MKTGTAVLLLQFVVFRSGTTILTSRDVSRHNLIAFERYGRAKNYAQKKDNVLKLLRFEISHEAFKERKRKIVLFCTLLGKLCLKNIFFNISVCSV